ncbi:hypothetical protein I4U23_020080 [Adineta vaga]|nr:hypothetical protein I4U23_020080 [Adineta vaga]
MESIPDELFLSIFRYLDKFDLICAFNNLNQRFQHLTQSYVYHINLIQGNIFYKQFQHFCYNILPSQQKIIRSLQFDQCQQLQLFRPHIRQLINLESLTLKLHETYDYTPDVLRHFLIDALSLVSLRELSISVRGSRTVLKTISSFATSNLQTLTLLHSHTCPDFYDILPMPYIKYFSCTVQSIKTLENVFQTMINLKELNLSVSECNNINYLNCLKIPKTFEKLHLECGRYGCDQFQNLHVMRQLFNIFKNKFQSLKPIESHDKKKFFTISLDHENMQIVFNNGQFQPFDLISRRVTLKYGFSSTLSSQQLIYCTLLEIPYISSSQVLPNIDTFKDNIKFVNLKKIIFTLLNEDIVPNMYQYLSKIIDHSPNLNTLTISIRKMQLVIEHLLQLISPKHAYQITDIEFETSWHHSTYEATFFFKLSQILPNLKSITFTSYKQFINHYPITLNNLLEDLQVYFKKLVHFKLLMYLNLEMNQNAFESYKKSLDEQQQQQNDNRFYYTVKKFKTAELEYYSSIKDGSLEMSAVDGVWQSDGLILVNIKESLITNIASFENVPEQEKDWHPNTNQQILDLVHPSLFCLINEVSRIIIDQNQLVNL